MKIVPNGRNSFGKGDCGFQRNTRGVLVTLCDMWLYLKDDSKIE